MITLAGIKKIIEVIDDEQVAKEILTKLIDYEHEREHVFVNRHGCPYHDFGHDDRACTCREYRAYADQVSPSFWREDHDINYCRTHGGECGREPGGGLKMLKEIRQIFRIGSRITLTKHGRQSYRCEIEWKDEYATQSGATLEEAFRTTYEMFMARK